LYTKPITIYGNEYRSSPGNIAFLKKALEDPAFPADWREEREGIIRRMEDTPGEDVAGRPNHERILGEVMEKPRTVAIIMDNYGASSTEEFLLMARQSDKVTLFGEPTLGCLDYANVRDVLLPSERRIAWIPLSKSSRLPENPIDETGVLPDVPIPDSVDDRVAFVMEYFQNR
jgi:C-terminal processing protease CtpA/Prc